MQHVLLIATLSLLALPTASAATIVAEPGSIISDAWFKDIEIAQGEDVTITSAGTLTIEAATYLRALPGAPGADAEGPTAIAEPGGSGGSLTIVAPLIRFEPGVILQAGDGGPGGHALAISDRDAFARGGAGGSGGSVQLVGEVLGSPQIIHGNGGPGGDATAEGGRGCDGRGHKTDDASQPAPAQLGDGTPAAANGGAGRCGDVGEDGETGGNATAIGGDGGTGPDGDGGRGGDALAIAGSGGHGYNACFASVAQAEALGNPNGGRGGDGGRFLAFGGTGGRGAGTGGAGGDAEGSAIGGRGGNGTELTGSRQGLQETPSRLIAEPGGGGSGSTASEARGGDGGFGFNGGPGGAGFANSTGGDGGSVCIINPLADASIPGPSALPFATMLIVLTAWRARRNA